jgi:hypothetical protein
MFLYQNPLFDKFKKQPVLNYLDAVLFHKINNYKGRKKRTYKVEKIKKGSLKMETKNNSEYSFKTNYNCNIPNNSTHLKLKYNR